MSLQTTPIPVIEQYHATLYKTFKAGTCRPLSYRKTQLHQLARMLQENREAFAHALDKDLAKPKLEAYLFEIGGVIERSLKSAAALEEWSKAEEVPGEEYQRSWNIKIHKAPKGPVLVIAPWNYPLILTLQSIIAAMSAGCPAVMKPSEFAPALAQLLADLSPKYLDPNAYVVVNGAIPETSKLLELKWAHIFYTGNGRVGRIVASAAARHLTPVSLELGGKSPVIIDGNYDISLAAKRVLFGKGCNAGQTCVAPDYILIQKEKQAELVEALRAHLQAFYPESEGGALGSASYGRIVNRAHFERLKGILGRTKGNVVIGGNVNEEKFRFEPTTVADVSAGDSLMEDEIFGPLLPIVPVANLDEAIEFVNERDQPLAFYVFTDSPEFKQKVLDETLSGSIIFNDTFQQLAVNDAPFSGVGESGYGAQVMRYGFDGFTHHRTSLDMPKEAEPFLGLRYPPYSQQAFEILTAGVNAPIPAPNSS